MIFPEEEHLSKSQGAGAVRSCWGSKSQSPGGGVQTGRKRGSSVGDAEKLQASTSTHDSPPQATESSLFPEGAPGEPKARQLCGHNRILGRQKGNRLRW